MRHQNIFRIGIAGWGIPREHDHLFLEGDSHLARYAKVINCAEINTSFYRPYRPATYKNEQCSLSHRERGLPPGNTCVCHRNFYALGTLIGGVGAPLLFGVLIATHCKTNVALAYALGGVLLLVGAICECFLGVEAAGKSFESISKPLQSV